MERLRSFQSNRSPARDSTNMNFAGYPVVINKTGNVLKITGAGGTALNPDLAAHLTRDLRYDHVEQLHGQSRKNPITGQRLYFQTREYKLYRREDGQVVLLAGYMARMINRLRKLG